MASALGIESGKEASDECVRTTSRSFSVQEIFWKLSDSRMTRPSQITVRDSTCVTLCRVARSRPKDARGPRATCIRQGAASARGIERWTAGARWRPRTGPGPRRGSTTCSRWRRPGACRCGTSRSTSSRGRDSWRRSTSPRNGSRRCWNAWSCCTRWRTRITARCTRRCVFVPPPRNPRSADPRFPALAAPKNEHRRSGMPRSASRRPTRPTRRL